MIYPKTIEEKIGFAPIREMVKEQCVSASGRAEVERMEFSSDYGAIMEGLESTAEMTAVLESDDRMPLEGMSDKGLELALGLRPPGSFLGTKDLLEVRSMLGVMAEVEKFMERHRDEEGVSEYPRLAVTAADLRGFPEVTAVIDRVLDRHGEVKDNASAELAEIRRQLRSASGAIASIMRRVMARAVSEGVLEADTTPSVRDGRLVLPVAPMNKRRVNGIVHDQSASGKTVFIEPAEVVEANNRVRELEMDERREITRIMMAVADEIRPHLDEIKWCGEILGTLDFIRAKAKVALATGGMLPTVSDEPEMEWYHACHPVLKQSVERQGREIVPLDIVLDKDHRMLVISGPNAGGKSVCLKTAGALQYMLQCGMLPPVYENSRAGVFSDMFVDLGDDQSLEDDLSTYSSHLKNMKVMLQRGRERSLVLVDEMGGGTEPQIGAAIAQAILMKMNELGMWGIVTTHYQNLKHVAEETPGLVNGSMLYDRHLMQPLYKLSIGTAGSSFAIEIARKTGLPAEIIEKAGEIVGSDYVNLDKYLLDVARDRRYWENKRTAIRQKEKRLEQMMEKYEHDAETLRQSRREILDDARNEARRILEGSNAAVERTIHDIKRSQAEREKTLEARRRLEQVKEQMERDETSARKAASHPLLQKAPKAKKKAAAPVAVKSKDTILPGSHVKLDGQGTVGTVTEINGTKATVTFGMIKTAVDIKRLTPTIAQPKSGAGKATFISDSTSASIRERQLKFKNEIDVRGMRVDEAIQAVTYFIDDAVQFQSERVRILHGTGTGALRQSIREYLKTVRGVASCHDEDVRLGGAGITVVEF